MTSYFSTAFIILFLPVAILLYALAPRRARWAVLLLASYGFIWLLSRWLIVFVWASTLSVYVLGQAIGVVYRRMRGALAHATGSKREVRRQYKRKARLVLALGVITNLGILVALKYLGFLAALLGSLEGESGALLPRIGAPIGISFYTLMAVSYLVDVYRESMKPDRHLGHVALFLSYFPYLMEGPIVRYEYVAPSLWAGDSLHPEKLYEGSVRILWGFAKKLVVADRLNPLVNSVFSNHATHDGGVIALAAVLYTVQLYCDFSGTMDVALGMSNVFGIVLPENFRQPFFSRTASEFWRRWHITLGAWFKDYVYYPTVMSKPCKSLTKKARKRFGKVVGPTLVSMIALFFVWLGNGLWHGAGTQYVMFGMYYFVIISIGALIEPVAQRLTRSWKIDRESIPYVVLRIGRTLAIVFAGELIFRAENACVAFSMLQRIATGFSWDSFANDGVLSLGLDALDFRVVGVGVGLVALFDMYCERGGSPWHALAVRGPFTKWVVWALLLLVIVVFGAYGYGYAPVDPMYAQF